MKFKKQKKEKYEYKIYFIDYYYLHKNHTINYMWYSQPKDFAFYTKREGALFLNLALKKAEREKY